MCVHVCLFVEMPLCAHVYVRLCAKVPRWVAIKVCFSPVRACMCVRVGACACLFAWIPLCVFVCAKMPQWVAIKACFLPVRACVCVCVHMCTLAEMPLCVCCVFVSKDAALGGHQGLLLACARMRVCKRVCLLAWIPLCVLVCAKMLQWVDIKPCKMRTIKHSSFDPRPSRRRLMGSWLAN